MTDVIRRNDTNATTIVEALSVYISAVAEVNSSSGTQGNTLTIAEIDAALEKVTGVQMTIEKDDSFIMAQTAKNKHQRYYSRSIIHPSSRWSNCERNE